jgi:hypothetical protein
MYNPTDDLGGRYNEWIELYNPADISFNLSGWKIVDTIDRDLKEFTSEIVESRGYFIIAKKPENFSQIYNMSCPIARSSFSLINGGEEIILKDSFDVIKSNLTYSSSLGANGDGKSLQFFDNSWQACTPTPGGENYCPPPPTFDLNYPPHVLNDETVFLVEVKVENFLDGKYDVKIDMKDGDVRIGRIYDSLENKWQSTISYVNGALDVDGGAGSYLASLKINTDFIGTATLQGKLRSSEGTLKIGEYIFNVVGDTTNILELEGEETEQTLDSSIEIVKIKPEEVSFGDVVSVELNIYKNSTGKYSLSVWAEKDGKKISEKTKFHLKTKDREYRLFLPVQLDSNCNEKIDDGGAELIVEGLGVRVEKGFEISGINEKNCKEIVEEKECGECEKCEVCESIREAKGDSLFEEENFLDGNLLVKKGIVDEISGIIVYESSSEKAKGMIPYLMIAFLGILSLVLVWKRV